MPVPAAANDYPHCDFDQGHFADSALGMQPAEDGGWTLRLSAAVD